MVGGGALPPVERTSRDSGLPLSGAPVALLDTR
jgi:hypothetical protein